MVVGVHLLLFARCLFRDETKKKKASQPAEERKKYSEINVIEIRRKRKVVVEIKLSRGR
jgi:hypothetical protein